MFEYFYAALLGVVQAFTEFLPVSSSAHLILVSEAIDGEAMPLALNVALHMGTALAVLLYFWRDWLAMGRGVLDMAARRPGNQAARVVLPGLILGSVPAGVLGIAAHEWIEETLHHPLWVVAPLILVGVALWLSDRYFTGNDALADLSIKKAFLIGMAQATALFPGVSRSGATILCARALGLGRVDAARYSFLLGTPAMMGAALLKGPEILEHSGDPRFGIGFLTSFIVGLLVIRFFLGFLRRFGFGVFAVYRVLLGLLILALWF